MKHVKIKIKLEPGAEMPTRAHDSDVGYDVKALRTWFVQSNGTVHQMNTMDEILRVCESCLDCAKIKIDTGVHVTPQPGYYVELVPNSRISKTPFMVANSFGVIDPEYTGSMHVVMNCVNRLWPDDLMPFMRGRVVGQLIIRERISADFEQVDELEETERGDGGFGSTEKICHSLSAENAKQNDLSCTSDQGRNETDHKTQN